MQEYQHSSRPPCLPDVMTLYFYSYPFTLSPLQLHTLASYPKCQRCKGRSGAIRTPYNLKSLLKMPIGRKKHPWKLSINFIQEEGLKLSGVNKKVYANGLKALESMLDLSTNITIKDLAIQFGCTPATELAMKTLQRYDTLWYCNFKFSTKTLKRYN